MNYCPFTDSISLYILWWKYILLLELQRYLSVLALSLFILLLFDCATVIPINHLYLALCWHFEWWLKLSRSSILFSGSHTKFKISFSLCFSFNIFWIYSESERVECFNEYNDIFEEYLKKPTKAAFENDTEWQVNWWSLV